MLLKLLRRSIDGSMTKYPNRDALRQANDIYLDYMRPFVIHHLKQVPGEIVEDLIAEALTDEQMDKFWGKLDEDDDIESAIDFNYFPLIIKNNWSIIRNERNYGFAQPFNGDMDVQSMLWLIRKGRNSCEHRGTKDLDSEFVRVNLFYLADVLGKINRPDQQHEVECIRDQLFSNEVEEHPVAVENAGLKENLADMTEQLDVEKSKRIELEKQVPMMSTRLKIAVAGKTVAEERLSDIANRLEETEVEKTELEKRLKTMSDRLKDVERENTADKKRIEIILNQLATLKTENAQLGEYLETTSTQLEDVKKELAVCKEHPVQPEKEPLPLNPNPPDSITFQGTTFTRHLNKYHVTEDDISQNFWHYWHSQGREGKQEMRDAGWSVEKVNGDWEVTISTENFQAWIEDEVSELSSLINPSQSKEPSTPPPRSSYRKTVLPASKEMEQPALELLADGREHRRLEIINLLTEHFALTADERSYLSKTGQAEKHLVNKGLIERTRTGYYRITTRGRRKVRTG